MLTPNLAGGFLAVGMTDEHPGFVVLSALGQTAVDVRADHYTNDVAGDFTVAAVRSPRATWRRRLRGPVAALVRSDGAVEGYGVEWSARDFSLMLSGTDCSHVRSGSARRCGAPFADLFDLVAEGRIGGVPEDVRGFLARYARPKPEIAGSLQR